MSVTPKVCSAACDVHQICDLVEASGGSRENMGKADILGLLWQVILLIFLGNPP
jgi:hypothetical protein